MDEGFDFEDVLGYLKEGRRIAREGWNGKDMYLVMVWADQYEINKTVSIEWGENAPEKLPWIGMKTAQNGFVPWLASQTDLLATDWRILEDNEV